MAQCCPDTAPPPVIANYTGKGETITLRDAHGEFQVYVAGKQHLSHKKAVLNVPDVFGLTNNSKQVADHVAEGACVTVFVIDAFRGKPLATHPFPPAGGWPEVMAWIGTFTWDKVKPMLDSTVAHAKEHGVTQIGLVGMCWGAKQAYLYAAEVPVQAVAGAHPSQTDVADAKKIPNTPQCILAAKDDPEWKEFEKFVKHESPVKEKNFWKRYENAHHGWMGTRGGHDLNLADPAQATDTANGIADLAAFFKRAL